MIVSEDGSVTGSIDNSKLDQIEPKSDEAQAQIEQLRREAEAGQEQATADAERLAEQSRRQAFIVRDDDGVERARQSDGGDVAEQQRESVRQQDRAGDGQQAQSADSGSTTTASQQQAGDEQDVDRLRAEAEQAGVTVDKRWGADRLQQEIDTAKAGAQSRRQRG